MRGRTQAPALPTVQNRRGAAFTNVRISVSGPAAASGGAGATHRHFCQPQVYAEGCTGRARNHPGLSHIAKRLSCSHRPGGPGLAPRQPGMGESLPSQVTSGGEKW